MKIYRVSLLLGAASLGACDGQFGAEKNEIIPLARVPEQVCRQATNGLEQLKQSGGFVLNAAGEATLDEQAWMRMDGRQRDQLVQLVAYDAACKGAEPVKEQNAVIRSEYGRVLTEQVVEIAPDASAILGSQ